MLMQDWSSYTGIIAYYPIGIINTIFICAWSSYAICLYLVSGFILTWKATASWPDHHVWRFHGIS